jgi:hypothetical protein
MKTSLIYSSLVKYTFLLLLVLLPFLVSSNEINIRPFLIDESLPPRGESQNLVTLENEYENRNAVIFATVNEISLDGQGDVKEFISPVATDRTNTVTSWIEVTRGRIEIPPGETREVPITIKTHPYAEPGVYHAFIGFVEAKNRPTAENIAMAGDARGVVLKITVEDSRTNSLKINSFRINRFITGDDKKNIDIEIENQGDLPSAPVGEIIFYDSKGVEINSVSVESDEIKPGETGVVQANIPMGNELGRFKANLSLRYGENQSAALFDTSFFYLMPTHMMVIIFISILAIALLVVFLLRRSIVTDEIDDSFGDVTMYVKDGHEANPQDHDIDLKNKN